VRGLLKLTWLETKIFVREPMGVFGSVGIPVLIFVVLGRTLGPAARSSARPPDPFFAVVLPVFATLMIALSAVLSLVTIMAIYREGGILKRLRATPLHPNTILAAHVLVKLLMTAITVALLIVAGRRYYPGLSQTAALPFAAALLFSTLCILALGFLVASIVPTARFAQPLGAAIFYPLIALSGLFFPVSSLPSWLQVLARLSPLTYAVSLMEGAWLGHRWTSHLVDVGALTAFAAIGLALSARWFRWE
jgi:ABC-2 type transport system permease protein